MLRRPLTTNWEATPVSTRCFIAITVAGFTVISASMLPVQAQRGTESPPAWKEQLLLGDQLRIDAPANANIEKPRYEGIMGPLADSAAETRTRIAILGTEIVVRARRLDAFAPKDLSAGIKSTEYFAEFTGTRQERVLDLGPGWKAVAVFPERHRYWKDTYVLAYAWVQSPNGLLFDLMVGSWADSTKYAQLAQSAVQIASSLRPGTNLPDIPNGMTRLESQQALPNEIELVITLDGRHALTTERGHDFVVHRISPLVEFGSPSGELGIYIGRHPQFDRKAGSKAMADQLEILGKRPTWYVREDDGWRRQTTLIQFSAGRTRLKAHLFIAGTAPQVDTLVGLARTLRVKPKD